MTKQIQLTKAEWDETKRLDAAGELTHDACLQSNRSAWVSRGQGSPAQKYERYMGALDEARRSGNLEVGKAWDRANDVLMKDIAVGTVHQNATLSNMSVQYANEAYIGDQLMPVLQVAKESDTYYTYGRSDRLQYPDDAMDSRGQANEIQETRTTSTYTCLPYGYSNFVAQRTLNNQDAPLDEMVDLVEGINEGLAFRRELRIATILTAAGSFTNQTVAIAAGNRWDTSGGGNPIADVQAAVSNIWMGRGPSDIVGYCSLTVANVLSRHPQILDLFKYNGSSPGLATPDMVSRFFGMSKILVGKARQDTATEGAAASYSRMWGDVFGMVRVARRASTRNAVYGYTHRHLQPVTAVQYDPLKGHGGGFTAQVSVSEVHSTVAVPTGYLITTPVG